MLATAMVTAVPGRVCTLRGARRRPKDGCTRVFGIACIASSSQDELGWLEDEQGWLHHDTSGRRLCAESWVCRSVPGRMRSGGAAACRGWAARAGRVRLPPPVLGVMAAELEAGGIMRLVRPEVEPVG